MRNYLLTLLSLVLLSISSTAACSHNLIASNEKQTDGNSPNNEKENAENDSGTALTLNLLPEFPYSDSNPFVKEMYKLVKRGNTTVSTSFKEADEVLAAAYAYMHPDSQLKGDQTVKNRLVLLLTNFLQFWPKGEKLGDMMFTFQCSLAYYMLLNYSPDDLPAELTDSWNEGLRKQTEYVFNQSKEKKDLYDNLEVASLWLNGDIRLALGAYFAGKILKREDWCKKVENMMEKVLPQTLLNGGGTRYVSYQNESPTYHIASKQYMYWWWILTGSENIRNAMKKMNPYCPLTVHPIGKGYAEYTSSPSWKPYYNQNIPTFPAAIAAYMFDDPYNGTLGKNDKTWELAFIYKPEIKTAALPENYVVLDENNIGPRGKFGNWGYVGVARNVQAGDPELPGHPYPALMDGKSALAGAYLLKADAKSNEYPIQAAFHSSMPAAKTSPGEETDFNRGNKYIDLTSNEHTAITKGKEIYSLASRYTLSKKRFKAIAWDGIQEWVFTPDRIIGLLHIESMADNNKVYGLVNRTKLVGGRKNASGKDIKIQDNGNGTYNYGGLNIKIHDENYGGGHHCSYFGIFNAEGDKRSCMLTLRDEYDKGNDTPHTYNKGYRKYVLIECTKENEFARNAKTVFLPNSDLLGFEFEENGTKYTIIHNPTDTEQRLETEINAIQTRMYIQHSWKETTETMNVSNNKCTLKDIVLPPYGHILLINGQTFNGNYNTYHDIFK